MPSRYDDRNYSFDVRDVNGDIHVDVFQKTKGRELFYLRTVSKLKTIEDVEKATGLIKSVVPPISR